ncbi:glycosyltransferase family 4 protein [bacterium]|nr:glycosyltransferase family 4 protein [bacterium]
MILNLTARESTVTPEDGEEIYDLIQLHRLLNESKWQFFRLFLGGKRRRCLAIVTDHSVPQRYFFVKLLCLLARSRERAIVDWQGRSMPVDWGSFIAKDIPEFIGDAVLSVWVLWRSLLRVAWYLRAKPTRPTIDGTNKKFYYFRTGVFYGLKAGGSVGHITGVAKNVIACGYDLTAFAIEKLTFLMEAGVPVRGIPAGRAFRNFLVIRMFDFHLRFAAALKKIAKREGPPAMAYQRLSLNDVSGVEFTRKFKIPFILEYNGSEVWSSRNWGETKLALTGVSLKMEEVNFRHAHLIVVVSDPLLDELVGRGVDAGKILVNPNGVDVQIYSPERFTREELLETRRELGLAEDAVVAGFIGTFSPWHGVEVLAQAIPLVHRRVPELRFLQIGDGPLLHGVKRTLRDAGAEQTSVFTGLVPQMHGPRLLACCDFFLSPHVPNPDGSRFFGSPTKLFEYMALGKGIVASDLEQIGQVLEHEKTALMVTPGDVDELADAIVRLANDKDLRDELGRNARAEALEKYTWEKHVQRILERLEERVGTR